MAFLEKNTARSGLTAKQIFAILFSRILKDTFGIFNMCL